MSEEERQAIIHLLDKQARYEYCIKNNISFSDEDYEAYIIRQSMINKDKEIERLNKCYCERTDCSGRIKNSKKYESMQEEIERLNNIINELEKELDRGYRDLFEYELVPGRELITNIKNYLQELKGSDKYDNNI